MDFVQALVNYGALGICLAYFIWKDNNTGKQVNSTLVDLKELISLLQNDIDNKLEKLEGLKRGWYDLLLSRVNEIVELARIYIIVYRLEPIQAIEYAIKDIEENDKEGENE